MFETQSLEAQLKNMQAHVRSGLADTKASARYHQLKELKRLGEMGVKWLDRNMTRKTMEGWAYSVDTKEMSITWFHPKGDQSTTQHGKLKEGITVNDVLRFLNYGTTPSYGPSVAPYLVFEGKYDYAGRFFKLQNVKGIDPQRFLQKVREYVSDRSKYHTTTAIVWGESVEMILNGRRSGFVKTAKRSK